MAVFSPLQADALVHRLLDPRELFEQMTADITYATEAEAFAAFDRTFNDCDRLRGNLRANRRIDWLFPNEKALLDHIVATAPPEDKRVLKNAADRIASIPVEG